MNRDRVPALCKPAPITFDPPPADHGCAGTWRPFKGVFNPLCHTCERFGKGGPQVDPSARIVNGGSRCLNLLPIADAHAGNDGPATQGLTSHESHDSEGGKKAPSDGFRNAGVTGGVL